MGTRWSTGRWHGCRTLELLREFSQPLRLVRAPGGRELFSAAPASTRTSTPGASASAAPSESLEPVHRCHCRFLKFSQSLEFDMNKKKSFTEWELFWFSKISFLSCFVFARSKRKQWATNARKSYEVFFANLLCRIMSAFFVRYF